MLSIGKNIIEWEKTLYYNYFLKKIFLIKNIRMFWVYKSTSEKNWKNYKKSYNHMDKSKTKMYKKIIKLAGTEIEEYQFH